MYERELETAKSIAIKAGKIMRQYFDGNQERSIKDDGTPLTIADTTIHELVQRELKQAFASDGFTSEEGKKQEYGSGRRWFCDPIDGTRAFTWGVPTAMFSLGLVVDGVPTVGVAYEPMLDKMYWAIRGSNAYCNDTRIHVNTTTLGEGIFASISSPYRIRRQAPYLDALLDYPQRIDMATFSGAVAKTVRVADGRFTGYIEELVNAYDMAAVHVILEAAGGMITDLQGRPLDYTAPFKGCIVSNKQVHDELVVICNG
jgi:fructose-1,6-bisphosphatase/inositol monophosphatase family enzyme